MSPDAKARLATALLGDESIPVTKGNSVPLPLPSLVIDGDGDIEGKPASPRALDCYPEQTTSNNNDNSFHNGSDSQCPSAISDSNRTKESIGNGPPPSPLDVETAPDQSAARPQVAITEAKCLEFESPFDFVSFFDVDIVKGHVTLYPWQQECLDMLAERDYTKEAPLEFALKAANGSGKDKYLIAPFACWLMCCFPKARCIITTSSGGQLSAQTEPYIRQLASKVNEFQGGGYITIQQRHITCKETGSEIQLFATDEGTKAEGFHPWMHNSKMALIVNEAKSVLPEIFEALTRCTGYSHNIMVSSPGGPVGDFYKYYISGIPLVKTVTAYDCHHITAHAINKAIVRYGKDSPLFRSMVLAEFAALDSLVAIKSEWLEHCYELGTPQAKLFTSLGLFAGLDFSMGGDEIVLDIWHGNKELALIAFRLHKAQEIVERIVRELQRWNVPGDKVNADDGGIGRPLIDLLHERRYYVNRILNQSSALDTRAFLNRGAEMYFNLGRIMQGGNLVFLKDQRREQQLTNRKYKQTSALGKFCLQSKAEARAEGQSSPDRGDATVLAFAGKSVEDFATTAGDTVTNVNLSQPARISIQAAMDYGSNYQPHIRFTEPDPFNNPVEAYRQQLLAIGANSVGNRRCFGSVSRIVG